MKKFMPSTRQLTIWMRSPIHKGMAPVKMKMRMNMAKKKVNKKLNSQRLREKMYSRKSTIPSAKLKLLAQ